MQLKYKYSYVLTLIFLFIIGCGGNQVHPPSHYAIIPTPLTSPSPLVTPGVIYSIPIKLSIPKLGVQNLPIEQVSTNPKGQMDTPHVWNESAWYSPGVIPGNYGDAVIDGHLNWIVNGNHVIGPFSQLSTLHSGDTFTITTQTGQSLNFVTTRSENLDYTITPMQLLQKGYFSNVGNPRVTLITCSGDWNPSAHSYTTRLAVTGELNTTE